jgi:hypothetical protein
MVSTDNKEIKVTASDALEFEPVLHESSSGGWGWKIFLSLILVGGGTGAWVLYGDTLMERLSCGDGSVPLIKAAAGPIKVRPENPGGLKVPNRDKLVYDRMQKRPAAGKEGPNSCCHHPNNRSKNQNSRQKSHPGLPRPPPKKHRQNLKS